MADCTGTPRNDCTGGAKVNCTEQAVTLPLGLVKKNLNLCLPRIGIRHTAKGYQTDFYVLVCAVNLALSLYPLLCYFSISQNKHVVFWMGQELQNVNLMVPALLFCMSLALPAFKQMRVSFAITRVLVMALFITAGCLLVACGMRVTRVSYEVSFDLIYACGSSSMTEEMQTEWQRLSDFQAKCSKEQGIVSVDVRTCPGFAQMLVAPHVTYTKYLQAMETDFGCQGFCHFWATPLFDQDAGRGTRCASAVGQEMSSVGKMVGIPTSVIGVLVMAVGVVLAGAGRV